MANARRKPHEDEHSILFAETGGICPLCSSSIMHTKAGSEIPTKGYEAAHIYPLNPTAIQISALQNHAAPKDVNSIENFILLCPSCHRLYDKNFKIEEYEKLVAIKKGFLDQAKANLTVGQYTLEQEVCGILDIITKNAENPDESQPSKYIATSINSKLKKNITPLLVRDIRYNIIDFFIPIKEHIRLLEMQDQNSIMLLQSQVSSYYRAMQRQYPDNKDAVFKNISEWISKKSGKSILASKILTSFFIQNCEVFDADPQ